MPKDDRLNYKLSGAPTNADRHVLYEKAKERFADNPTQLNGTMAWIRAGKRTVQDLRGLATRWNIILPSDEREGR